MLVNSQLKRSVAYATKGAGMSEETRKKTDLRVLRTRKLLRDALVALIEEQGFEAITVTDLAQRAMINRATFYRHFRDKRELLEWCIDEALVELSAKADTIIERTPTLSEALFEILVADFEYLAENEDFARVMLGRDVPAAFAARIRDFIMKSGRRHAAMYDLSTAQGLVPYEVSLSFSTGGYVSAMIWWVENNMPYTPEQMARYVTATALAGVLRVRGWDLPLQFPPSS
jgi:AcrR family transcriptional regulator